MVHRMFCNVKMTNAFVEITIPGAVKVNEGLLLATNHFYYALVSYTLLWSSSSFLFFSLFRFVRCNDDVRANNRIDDDRSRDSVINIRTHRTIFSTIKKKHKSFVYRDTIFVLSLLLLNKTNRRVKEGIDCTFPFQIFLFQSCSRYRKPAHSVFES